MNLDRNREKQASGYKQRNILILIETEKNKNMDKNRDKCESGQKQRKTRIRIETEKI